MNQEQVQKLINLTPAQAKAWKALELAVRLCEKEKIYFYMNLEKLGALNGKNVVKVDDDRSHGEACCLQWLDFPRIIVTDAWADDSHYVVLKD